MEAIDKIILFGSGAIGYEAITFLGADNVECYCDNDSKVQGREKYGKRVISFEVLKSQYNNAVIVISANDRNTKSIVMQLEENGIEDYVDYKSIRNKFDNREQALSFLSNPTERMQLRFKKLVLMIEELTEQVNYFKAHADIRSMRPAEGELRERQLKIIKESAVLFQKLSELNIKPILDSGNLLGYVRNGGFIPWDDDVDFTLIREEYDKLKQYCKQSIYTGEEFYSHDACVNKKKNIAKDMRDYYWADVGDHFIIVKCFADGSGIGFDFFSLDYYSDNYPFIELVKLVDRVKEEWIKSDSNDAKIECMRKALEESRKYTVKKSDHVYFGIDSMTIMNRYKRHKDYIPSNILFPLQQVLYEGEYFWVPNQPEAFVSYEYDNIWEFPNDIGIPRHV